MALRRISRVGGVVSPSSPALRASPDTVPFRVDLNPFADAAAFSFAAEGGSAGRIVNVTRLFSYGRNAHCDGVTASAPRSRRAALSSARSFTANVAG